MEQSFEQIKKIIGEPRNYGPTPEEKAEMDRRALEEKVCVFTAPLSFFNSFLLHVHVASA